MTIKFLLTVWSIRLSLLLFATSVVLRARGAGQAGLGGSGTWKVSRAVWIAACLLAVVHVLSVYGYLMNWSHQASVADTARRTQERIGVSFGGGVYFNHLFLLIWTSDAAWWCGWPDRYLRRSVAWDVLVIGYLWFIAFNAAVVFETGATRWVGLFATAAMLAAGWMALVARKRVR